MYMDSYEKTACATAPSSHVIAQFPDPDTQCGIGCWKPRCLQPVARMIGFVPAFGLSVLLTSSLSVYFISQITTIERQFGISSTESGFLLAADEIGFMATVLFWSHFARKMHKPRFLAAATALFSLVSAMCAIPHFIFMSEEGEIYNVNTSSTGSNTDQGACRLTNGTSDHTAMHMAIASPRLRRMAYSVVAVGMVIIGICKAPRTPLGSTYIDDNVPKTRTGIYLGILLGLGIFGPLVGSTLGGVFSRMYVTLEETTMAIRDPRFVGAWWLGFVGIGVLTLLSAIPLPLFPRKMLTAAKQNSEDVRRESFKELLKDSYKSIWRLVSNPLFMIIILADGISIFSIRGFISFFPKYLEEHFHVEPGRSSILMGATILLGACSGSFLSGIMATGLKLTICGCLVVICIFETVGATILLSGIAITCDQAQLYGLASPSNSLQIVAAPGNWSCATSCHCTDGDFLPSCGSDGRTYYSPCHAGCAAMLPNRDFTNCACMPDMTNRTVRPGACEEECDSLSIYLGIAFITPFLATLSLVPITLAKLRSVEGKDRSLGMGTSALLSSILGHFLGPIAFGVLIDSSCILWNRQGMEDNENGFCYLYDTDDIRFKMHIFTGGGRICVLTLYLITLVLVFKMDRYQTVYEEQRQVYRDEKEAQLAKSKKPSKNPEHSI